MLGSTLLRGKSVFFLESATGCLVMVAFSPPSCTSTKDSFASSFHSAELLLFKGFEWVLPKPAKEDGCARNEIELVKGEEIEGPHRVVLW